MEKNKKKLQGFTLIELLVVLVIIGLLGGFVGPKVMKSLSGAKTKTTKTQIEGLAGALDIYKMDTGRYPTTEEGLLALVEKPSSARTWNGPYLRKNKVPQDAWLFDFHYVSPGQHGRFDLYSYGADNSAGGDGEDQDLNSWE